MTESRFKVPNFQNEQLDVLMQEETPDQKDTLVFIHGFGSNKHETAGLFDYLAAYLGMGFRTVRFDFSGFGDSEGKSEDTCLVKQAQDLESVMKLVESNWWDGTNNIHVLAHSLGSFAAAQNRLHRAHGRVALTGIPNHNTYHLVDLLQDRVWKNGGQVDEDGTTFYHRSSGEVQMIGPEFWGQLKRFDPLDKIGQLAQRHQVRLYHPSFDEVVGSDYLHLYDRLPGVKVVHVAEADHSFTTGGCRGALARDLERFFQIDR